VSEEEEEKVVVGVVGVVVVVVRVRVIGCSYVSSISLDIIIGKNHYLPS